MLFLSPEDDNTLLVCSLLYASLHLAVLFPQHKTKATIKTIFVLLISRRYFK